MNDEFKYSVMLFDEIEDKMNDRLIWIIKKLKRENEVLLEEELQLRIPEKKVLPTLFIQKVKRVLLADLLKIMRET